MHVASGSLVVLALLLGQAANPAAEQIAGWVKQLGDDDFAVRQAASDALWQAGAAAIPALAEAVRSPDAETAYRAKALLDKVRVGIRPNTPPELAALIDQFRFGSDSAQRTALAELRTKGQWPIVLALLRSEANLDRRRTLAQAVAPDAGKVIRPLLEKGQLDDAQAILELTAVQDPGQIQLNTFLLLTGRLESAVAELARQQATSPQPEDWRRLALMSRAAGNMPAAIAAAEKSSDKYLLLNLLSEARDWPRAAAVMVELAQANPTATDHAAFLATFQRLAENPAGYAEALKTLQRPPAPDPFAPAPAVPLPTSWAYAETLLINEQPTEAIIALLDSAPERAAMLLRQRHQVDRLLELAKVKNDAAFDGAWLASLPAAPGDARLQARVRVAIASQAALALRDLGRPADVDRITQTLLAAAASDPDDGRRWAAVARLFWQLGKYDDALSAAAIATGFMPPSQVFGEFIKPQAALAGFWFGSAKDIDPLVDRQKGVEAAVWMSVPRPPAGKEVADWKQRVDAAAVHVRKLEPKVRAAYLSLIAETCLVRGDRALAKSFHAEAATSSPAAAIKGGDLAAGDSDWAAAETWYRQAAEAPDSEPLALFLLGRSLVKLDRQEEGERLQKLATLLPLAPEARFQLASGLQERGLAAEAIAQFEIIGRTAGLDSAVAANAAQQLGNLVSAKEPLRAADGWRQLHLHVLNVSSNFVEVEGYLTLPHVIHKVRARGLFDQKKMPEVLVELATCQKLLPGDVRLVEEFVPRLEKEGLAAEAEKLFAAAHEVHAKIAQAHPTSAAYTNNTAWISARARRKLDEALPLAQKAIELAPREAAYHDTLAEIQFQRGDRPAAVAAAKKALALAPGNAFYEKRLAHFETAEPGQPSAVEIP